MIRSYTNATESNEVSKREEKNRQLAREVATESIVLLQNDGTLPIAACPVALYGNGAATTIKGGTGSGEVNERYSVTIEQGLINAGFTVTTDAYLREYTDLLQAEKNTFYKNLSKKMLTGSANDRINIMSDQFQYPSGRLVTTDDTGQGEASICIYVVARQAGECSDRKLHKNDFNLTQIEIDNLKFVSREYEKTIVIINTGGQMDISPLDEIGVNAIIYFCQQGMEGGNALVDLLTGVATPSGCLSSTWPVKYDDWPNAMEYSYLKGHTLYEEYKEGIYVGYRYFDSFGVTPRYEFGYGLSYTQFDIEPQNIKAEGADITVLARVTNSGTQYSGKKTVQLYVSAPNGKLTREYQSLVAFAKTRILAPGQSQELSLKFSLSDLAGYDEDTASYILEQGDYIVRLGHSCINAKTVAVVSLDSAVITEVCMNLCSPVQRLDEMNRYDAAPHVVPENVARINMNAAEFGCTVYDYRNQPVKPDSQTEELIGKLSVDDMLRIVCGTGMFGGRPAFHVPGAAANTTSRFVGIGLPNATLCDGPAGVRVQRTSVRYKSGKIKQIDSLMSFMEHLPGVVRRFMLGNPKKGALLYQHASSFPVGTAQAQTWNVDLIELTGRAIGEEMEEFGITFWLAPGMNIHRNPLCGRNFEYYSEDPLLTGKMAAAVIKGVQSHDGCYVTVKHFAANNQEDNRNRSDSIMSERTLREIYLKGFRIAVRESGAKSVMTSYNKINGTYTPNSYDLCTNILRKEWGFDGLVMTDWFSTGKGLADNGAAITAGNDLIMPGGKWYIKMLKKSIKAGEVNESDLRQSCARVVELVMKSRTGMCLSMQTQQGDGSSA